MRVVCNPGIETHNNFHGGILSRPYLCYNDQMTLILSIALALRLIFINQSLWLDESIEALALQGHFGPLLSYSLSDFQPPLYHFILKLWTSIAGYSEVSLRIPSLLAGIFTVYFVVKIGELIGSKKVGVIAGLLAATNPLLIYYSGEGRTYVMTAFLVAASFYFFIKILKSKNHDLRSTIYYLVFTTAFLWTSYLSWFVLLMQGLYAIYYKRQGLLLVQFVAASTLLLWLPSLINSLTIGMNDARLVPGWGKVVGGTSLKALALTWVKANIGRISFDDKYLYAGIVSLLAVLHGYVLARLEYKKISLLTLWILVPIVLGSLISLFVPAYSYTRVLFIVPAYLLILALGLSRLRSGFMYLVIAAQIIFLVFYWVSPQFHKEDWRSLTAYLNAQSGTVVLPSLKQDAPFIYYGLTLPLLASNDPSLTSDKVYYVRYVEEAFDPGRLGEAHLTGLGYTISSQRTLPGIALDIYEK